MRFGLVGAGGIGQIRIQALSMTKECKLTGIFDIDRARAEASVKDAQVRVFENYPAMLAADTVDAVIVSTPPQFHEEAVIAALEAGKPVLCEKPLGNSVESCRRMVATSRRTGVALATGFNHRYFPAIRFLKRTLDEGLIGELNHVRAFGGHVGLSEFRAPWMYEKKTLGGGALMDVGIHIIDLTRYLLGDVSEVYGTATGDVWKVEGSEDNAMVLMQSPNGKNATLQATWSEWKGYRFWIEIYGHKGMAQAYYAPMFNLAVFQDKPGGQRRKQYNFYPANILKEKVFGWQRTAAEAFCDEFRDFVELSQGRETAIADGFAGFRAVEIANAVYQSTAEKRPVRLTDPF